jgi:hypothetical protein
MADKTWVASDLKMGALKINRYDSTLHIEQRYVFLDEFDEVLVQIAGGRVVADVEWSEIPTSVQDALVAIQTWTKNQALIQEGMDE